MLQDKRGFTLIEVFISVAIISVIAFIAVGVTGSVFQKNQLAIERDEMLGTIRLAQSRSISGYQDDIWGVHVTSTSYTLFRGSTYAGRDSAYDEVHALPSGVTAAGLTDVIFVIRTGTTSNVGTITLSDERSIDEAILTINANGRVTDI